MLVEKLPGGGRVDVLCGENVGSGPLEPGNLLHGWLPRSKNTQMAE